MGAIDTNYTFTATDVITSTKMNNILDQSTITATAVFNNTLDVASGKLLVKAGGITSNELAVDAVLAISIKDANVTPAKLSNSDFGAFTVASGVATLDADVVTTAKILNANVTAAKLDGAQSGSAPIFGVRAWVVFDMTRNAAGGIDTANTTRYIYPNGSGNVTSVTKNATGDFTVAITTALPTDNYAYFGSGEDNDTSGDVSIARPSTGAKTTTLLQLKSLNLGGDAENFPEVCVQIIC